MADLQKILENKGIKFLPDNKGFKNRFEIKSETSSNLYVIAQRKNEREWTCGCPGWIRYRKCKHLQAVMPMIQQAERQAQSQPA